MITVSLDTETERITEFCKAPRLVCVTRSFSTHNGTELFRWDVSKQGVQQSLREHRIVGANIAYDMVVLSVQFPELLPLIFRAYREKRVTDAQLRQKLLDIAAGVSKFDTDEEGNTVKHSYSLDALSQRYGFGAMVKDEAVRLEFGALRDVPFGQWPNTAVDYATTDATRTLEIYNAQGGEIVNEYEQAFKGFVAQLRSVWGFCTDPEAVEKFGHEITDEYEGIKRALIALGWVRAKDGSRDTKKTKAHMIAVMGERCKITATGEKKRDEEGWTKQQVIDAGYVSLDEDACISSGDTNLVRYARLSSLGTTISTHIPALKRGRIHARFNPLVATGRESCSKDRDGTGMNLYNLPRKGNIRSCFVPRSGNVIIDNDYDGAELRAWSQVCLWVCGYSRMADALNAGKDVHSILAANLMGLDYEEFRARYKVGDPACIRYRQVSKIGDFGYLTRMGAQRLVDQARESDERVIMTLRDAEEVREGFFATWTESAPYEEWVRSHEQYDGTYAIEQFISRRVRSGMSYTEAMNTPFQGLIADLIGQACCDVAEACYVTSESPLFGFRPILALYDQILTEGPEERAHEAALEQTRLMIAPSARYLPDVPATTTPALCRRWSKKAETIYGTDGRLVPWDVAKES